MLLLVATVSPTARAADPGIFSNSLTACTISPTTLVIDYDAEQVSYGYALIDEYPGDAPVFSYDSATLNGFNYAWIDPSWAPDEEGVYVGGVFPLPWVNEVQFDQYVAGLLGRAWTYEVWAVADTFDDGAGGFGSDRANFSGAARYGSEPLCSATIYFVEGPPASQSTTPAPPSVGCEPMNAAPGETVTCTVTGGDPGIDILWRASYNPVIAEAGVTLGADGTGTFSFAVPAAARGQEVMVELVDWAAPMSLGVSGSADLVPTSVPAGEGPGAPAGPLAATVALALVAGMVVRRRASAHVG